MSGAMVGFGRPGGQSDGDAGAGHAGDAASGGAECFGMAAGLHRGGFGVPCPHRRRARGQGQRSRGRVVWTWKG